MSNSGLTPLIIRRERIVLLPGNVWQVWGISGCHNLGDRHEWKESKDVTTSLKCIGQPLMTKNYLATNMSSAKAEKPCVKEDKLGER